MIKLMSIMQPRKLCYNTPCDGRHDPRQTCFPYYIMVYFAASGAANCHVTTRGATLEHQRTRVE